MFYIVKIFVFFLQNFKNYSEQHITSQSIFTQNKSIFRLQPNLKFHIIIIILISIQNHQKSMQKKNTANHCPERLLTDKNFKSFSNCNHHNFEFTIYLIKLTSEMKFSSQSNDDNDMKGIFERFINCVLEGASKNRHNPQIINFIHKLTTSLISNESLK